MPRLGAGYAALLPDAGLPWGMLAVLTASAFACAFAGSFAVLEWVAGASRRRRMRTRVLPGAGRLGRGSARLREREPLAVRLAIGATRRLQEHPELARFVLPGSPRSQARVSASIVRAGLEGKVSPGGLALGRVRYAALLVALGAVVGLLALPQAALPLACGLGLAGWASVPRSFKALASRRSRQLESHLSEAVEVVCLGLRGGMPLDRSLALYCSCFDTLLARELRMASSIWSAGILSREQALRNLAASYDSAVFARVVDATVRSSRFGTPLADALEVLASEARSSHRAQVQEQVMKAPVKMMLPVGALILPSMLLLVMGPILLELAGGL